MAQKKPGFLVRLFSWKLKTNDADDDDDVCNDEEMRRRYKQTTARRHTVATATRQHGGGGGGGLRRSTIKTDQQMMAAASAASLQVDNPITYTDASLHSSNAAMRKCSSAKTSRSNSAERTAAVDELGLGKSMASSQVVVPRQRKVSSPRSLTGTLNRRSGQPLVKGQKPPVDVSRPLEFPATPETILEYHKQRPILNDNEEWLMVELNQFQCLVDSMDVIKIIAKHSKFFEVSPAELWEEFFEFVDEVPSYDEVINFDVWQEFRDKRYAC